MMIYILSADEMNIKYISDYYPISDENISNNEVESKIFPFPTAIYQNIKSKEVLIIESPSRIQFRTFQFYGNNVPKVLLNYFNTHLDLNNINIDLCKELDSLISNSKSLESRYFISQMGIGLGMSKTDVINIYGEPYTIELVNEDTVFVWDFWKQNGNIINNEQEQKLYNDDKFGYIIEIYFRNNKAYFIDRCNLVP